MAFVESAPALFPTGHGVGVARPMAAWQLRVEKLALEYHRPNHHGTVAVGPSGVRYDPTWFQRLEASLLHQATLISRAAHSCGVRTVWLESDLLFPSLTMWDAMFAPHVPSTTTSTRAAYGVPILNRTSGTALLSGLLHKVLAILREGSKITTAGQATGLTSGHIEVVTMQALLRSAEGVGGHELEPFTKTTGSGLLNLERSLLAVATLSQVIERVNSRYLLGLHRRECGCQRVEPAFALAASVLYP